MRAAFDMLVPARLHSEAADKHPQPDLYGHENFGMVGALCMGRRSKEDISSVNEPRLRTGLCVRAGFEDRRGHASA